MYNKIISCAVLGIDGMAVNVEADIHDGLPTFTMVGYLSSSVREAGERVRTALKNSGYFLPPKRITINLSPADIKKEGSGFDLPIALAILLSMGITPKRDINNIAIVGELGLDGKVKPVNGVLPMVHHCYKNGIEHCIVPKENQAEAMLVRGMKVVGVNTLNEAVEYIEGISKISPKTGDEKYFDNENAEYDVDFSDIKGQEVLKRGMEIATAGFHNVLMTGAAGAGKSMIAKRLPTIMPPLTFEESIEVTKIYSINGMLKNNEALIRARPFRAPHHSISNYAMTGGGRVPRPGEVSLAHNGVLFLDEIPEFNKNVLEVMRQPLEDRKITISRVNATYEFPSDFMLVAAMNPCPCGCYPNLKKCRCTPNQIKRYQGKISGPLLDRIDMNIEVRPLEYSELFAEKSGESSKTIRERVMKAIERQRIRYKDEGILFNSQLNGSLIKKFIILGEKEQYMLENYFKTMELSARGVHRILKLARTIADLDGSEIVNERHLTESIFYRNGINNQWGMEIEQWKY